MAAKGSVTVSATVRNVGQRRHHEVAQLYIHDKVASLVQPVRSLKGVKHLDLQPGQSATVEFVLSAADLAFVHADLKTAAEPGEFEVWISPSSGAGQSASFVLSA
jgi:beta-glucosidase